MDTTQKQQVKSACEDALQMYAELGSALRDGRSSFAKDKVAEIKRHLAGRQPSAFRNALAHLSSGRFTSEWASEVEISRSYIESYLDQLTHP